MGMSEQEKILMENMLKTTQQIGEIHSDVKNIKEGQSEMKKDIFNLRECQRDMKDDVKSELGNILGVVDTKFKEHTENCTARQSTSSETNKKDWKSVFNKFKAVGIMIGMIIVTIITNLFIK